MRTVRDAEGKRYLLLTQSGDSSRVRDPATGEERYLPNGELEPAEGVAPLAAAAAGVPGPVRRVIAAVPDERALGLLIELVDGGPVAAVELLERSTLCESDLHGLLAELRAAGLVTEAEAPAGRGYDATDRAREAVAALRA